MTVTSSQRLCGLGAILLVALTICSCNFSRTGGPSFILPLIVAGVAYLLSIREFSSAKTIPRSGIVFGLALAGVWHFLFLRLTPRADDDIHRYVWDGRVQQLGYNPYVLVPSDPAVAGLHTSETLTLINPAGPDVPSPYPSGAQLFFRVVTAVHESVFVLKVAFVLCDAAIVLVLLDLLRRTRRGEHSVLAYAWHPLLATDVAGSGHIDIVGALLLLVSAAALGELAKVDGADHLARPLARLSKTQRQAYQQVFSLIYECAPNRSVGSDHGPARRPCGRLIERRRRRPTEDLLNQDVWMTWNRLRGR